MTQNPAHQSAARTTYMRRYALDPELAEEFTEFLAADVFPARERRGFTVESAWLATEKDELTWYVSYPGGRADFDAAESEWEGSEERARIFSQRPKYVLSKDVRPVARLR